jgi:hypothetical protein
MFATLFVTTIFVMTSTRFHPSSIAAGMSDLRRLQYRCSPATCSLQLP